MKQLIAIISVLAALSAQSALVPLLDLTNNAGVTVVTASNGQTNTVTARNYITSPVSTSQAYPMVIQLRTNQNFVIQDDLGNNIFGMRADAYPNGTARHWEVNFGSKQQGLIDQLFFMGTGADIGWVVNGDINNAFVIVPTGTIGITYKYGNTNYQADAGGYVPVFDNYGTVYCTELIGQPIHATQAAVIGVASGSGGSVGAATDSDPTDISAQIILTTGNASLTTGVLATYNLACDAAQLNSSITNLPPKPVFSAANDNAANEIAKVYCVGIAGPKGAVTLNARAALTANTVYKYNLIIAK